MRILVIVVTYNGMKWLRRCLASIANSSVSADIFIIDNGSTDGTIKFIKENYSNAIFVESKSNMGFGKANNLGMKYAVDNNYDYVYLLNQDAWVERDTIRLLIEVHKANPEYGILSPLQVNSKANELDRNFLELSCTNKLISDSLCSQKMKSVYETDFVMAAHWLIPCDTIRKIGGFSPSFPQYGEDNNYIHRIKYRNYRVGICPQCKGVHDRENRILTISKTMHITQMTWRYILSNPIESKKLKTKKIFKSYLQSMLTSPWYASKSLFSLLYEINPLLKNMRMQKDEYAFL